MANSSACWPKESREDVVEKDDDWEVLSEDSCELEGFVLPEKLVSKWHGKYASPVAATSTPARSEPPFANDSNQQGKILDCVEPIIMGQQRLSSCDDADDAEIEYENDDMNDIPETESTDANMTEAEKEAGSLVYHNKANLADEIEQAVIGEQNDGGDAGLGCGCDTTVLSRATVNNGDERAVIKTSTSPSIIGSLFSRGAQSRESKAENKCTNDRGSKAQSAINEEGEDASNTRESNAKLLVTLDITIDNTASGPVQSSGAVDTHQAADNKSGLVPPPRSQGDKALDLREYLRVHLSPSLLSINCRFQFAAAFGLLVSCVVIFNNVTLPPSLRRVERIGSSNKEESKVLVMDDAVLKALGTTVTSAKVVVPTYEMRRAFDEEQHENAAISWRPLTNPPSLVLSPREQAKPVVSVPVITIGYSNHQCHNNRSEKRISALHNPRERALLGIRKPVAKNPLEALIYANIDAFENQPTSILRNKGSSQPFPFSDDNFTASMIEELDLNMVYQPALPPSLEEDTSFGQDSMSDGGILSDSRIQIFPPVSHSNNAVARIFTDTSPQMLSPSSPHSNTVLPLECHECVLASILGAVGPTHEQACESCQSSSREYAALGRSMAYTSNLYRNFKIIPDNPLGYT